MQKKEHGKRWCLGCAGAFMMASLTVFLIPLADDSRGGLSLMIGILFWLGILAGIGCYIMLWRLVKDSRMYDLVRKPALIAAFQFFKTPAAKWADGILLAAIILLIIDGCIVRLPTVVTLAGMGLLIFTICMHFVLNSAAFACVMRGKKRKREGKRHGKEDMAQL